MNRRRTTRGSLARLLRAGGTVSALCLVACHCPSPITLEQTFLLDASAGSTAEDAADAGTLDADAASSTNTSGDCTSAAAGCQPGGSCEPACACVLARDRIEHTSVETCRLVENADPAEVVVRYQQAVFCGGD
jgi:hypothetical protein